MLRSRNSNHFPWKSTGWRQPHTKPPGISASCQSERSAKNTSVRFWQLNLGLLFYQKEEEEINKAQTTRTHMQKRYFSRVGSQMHVSASTWEVPPPPLPLLFTLLSKQAYLHSVRGSIRWCLWLINPAPALHGNIFTQKNTHLSVHAKTWHWTSHPTHPSSPDCQIKTKMNGPCLYCLHTESESVSISGM